jgi:hypothetical protein
VKPLLSSNSAVLYCSVDWTWEHFLIASRKVKKKLKESEGYDKKWNKKNFITFLIC